MKVRFYFLDGRLLPYHLPTVENLSPWLLKGRGVFETMRAQGRIILFLEEHLKRMLSGLRFLKILPPYSSEKIKKYIRLLLKVSQLKNARIRLTVWEDPSGIHLSIMAYPFQQLTAAQSRLGQKAGIASVRRDERSALTRIKSIDYSVLIEAYRNAQARGFDETILLNRKGDIAECSRSNLFIVSHQQILTPSLDSGCLNGITRQQVIRIARTLGWKVQQKRITLTELYSADEAFLTNSLIEIMPLTRINEHRIREGKAGPITLKLLKQYHQQIQQVVK